MRAHLLRRDRSAGLPAGRIAERTVPALLTVSHRVRGSGSSGDSAGPVAPSAASAGYTTLI